MTRILLHITAGLVGAAVALVAVLAFDDGTRDGPRRIGAPPPGADVERAEPVEPQSPRIHGAVTMLAWIPGGVPAEAERVVEKISGIDDVTLVSTHLEWLTSSVGPDGGALDQTRSGYRIPFEVALIEPSSYAQFVAPSERQAVLSLGRGEILLSRSSSEIRRADRGSILRFEGRSTEVVGELSDVSAGGYEGVRVRLPGQPVTRSFLLAQADGGGAKKKVEGALRQLVGPSTPIRVRTKGETPFLRYGDAVPPQLLLKQAFGEFSARPGPRRGQLIVDDGWLQRNIEEYRVPILGAVRCHRALAPQLRAALSDLVDQGAAVLIDPDQFAGCFVARHINWDPDHFLSHHSWGVAVDLNARENRFGTQGSQDPRTIEAMESNGLGWGGRWLIPDPMHFEWSEFPD